MLITSMDNEKIRDYLKLKNKKYRDRMGLFLVEGEHLVLEAHRAGIIKEVLVEEDSVFPTTEDTIYVSRAVLNRLSEVENTPYVMAVCYKKEMSDTLGDRILLLDGVQDPGNLGTILRSGKAFDIDSVVLSEQTVDLYNPKVIRATQGMFFHMNVVRRDLIEVIQEMKKDEIPVYVTRVEFGEDVRTLKEKDRRRFALVMGNEGKGVSDEVKDLADKYIYIPMNEMVDSLNVAVATSILLYELKVTD